MWGLSRAYTMTKDRFTSRVAKDPACCVAAVLDFHRSATKQRALKTLFDDRRDGIILYRAADGKRRTPGGATLAAIVPSAGDTLKIVNFGPVCDAALLILSRCPFALRREITNVSKQRSLHRHPCRWMFYSGVRNCSERRKRSGGPKDHKIHDELEGYGSDIGSAEAGR